MWAGQCPLPQIPAAQAAAPLWKALWPICCMAGQVIHSAILVLLLSGWGAKWQGLYLESLRHPAASDRLKGSTCETKFSA